MQITFNSFNLNTELFKHNASAKYMFLLHGFSGSGKDWLTIAESLKKKFNIVTVDLIGHGLSDSPHDVACYTCPAIVSQLFSVIKSYTDDKIILCGYSMGGRAALAFAVHFPDLVDTLILEGVSPGIQSNIERIKRLKQDKTIANFILTHSMEEFTDFWMNLDIFSTQKRFSNEKLEELRQQKILNNKTGLSNSLIGFSVGMMPSFWDNLINIDARTLLLSGELDTKYSEINSAMVKLMPDAVHKKIPSAGHNTHLEEPQLFLKEITSFLS